MDIAVKNALDALRNAGRTAKEKQLTRQFATVLAARLDEVLVGPVSGRSIDMLVNSFSVDVEPFYCYHTELALSVAAAVIDDVYSTRLVPCLSVVNQSRAVRQEGNFWERLIDDGLIAGLQEYLEAKTFDSKAFADNLYGILCRMMTDKTAHAMDRQLRRQICATISDSIKCHDYNRCKLLNPGHLGDSHLGDLIVSNNSYLVLEPLFELMARLLPPKRDNKARAAIWKACFGSAKARAAFSTELLSKLGKIFLKATAENWEETAQKMFALMAESDIRRPQPLRVSNMIVWTRDYTTPVPLYVDEDRFVVSVQNKDDYSLSIMELLFSTITSITVREARQGGTTHIMCKSTSPPLLQAHPLSQQQPESSKVVTFDISTDDVSAFKRSMDARDMARTMAMQDPLKISSSPAIHIPVNWQSGGEIASSNRGESLPKRWEQLAQLTDSTSSDSPAIDDKQRTNNTARKNPEKLEDLRLDMNYAGRGESHSATVTCHDGPINPTISVVRSAEQLAQLPERAPTLMKTVFGSDSEELSEVDSRSAVSETRGTSTAREPLDERQIFPSVPVPSIMEVEESVSDGFKAHLTKKAVAVKARDSSPAHLRELSESGRMSTIGVGGPATRTRGRRGLKHEDKDGTLFSVDEAKATKRKRDDRTDAVVAPPLENLEPVRPAKKSRREGAATPCPRAAKAGSNAILSRLGGSEVTLSFHTAPSGGGSPMQQKGSAPEAMEIESVEVLDGPISETELHHQDKHKQVLELERADKRHEQGSSLAEIIVLSELPASNQLSEQHVQRGPSDHTETRACSDLKHDLMMDSGDVGRLRKTQSAILTSFKTDVKRTALRLEAPPQHKEYLISPDTHERVTHLRPVWTASREEVHQAVNPPLTVENLSVGLTPNREFHFEELESEHSRTQASLSPGKPRFAEPIPRVERFSDSVRRHRAAVTTNRIRTPTPVSEVNHLRRSGKLAMPEVETPRIPLQELPTAHFKAASRAKQKLDAARVRLEMLSERQAKPHPRQSDERDNDSSTDEEAFAETEGKSATLAIMDILDAIRDAVISNLNNKVAYVKSNVRVARAKMVADAKADLTILTRQKQQGFDRFAEVNGAYEDFTHDLGVAYQQLDQCDDSIMQTLHKTIKRHDKYSLAAKLSATLFL